MRVAFLLLLAGCQSYPLPMDMVVTETHYSDPDALYAVCGEDVYGRTATACVKTDYKTYCDMHLPVAMNGEPLHRWHEITHCGGRVDVPPKKTPT